MAFGDAYRSYHASDASFETAAHDDDGLDADNFPDVQISLALKRTKKIKSPHEFSVKFLNFTSIDFAGNKAQKAAAAADDRDLEDTSNVDAFEESSQSCNLETVAVADSHAVIRVRKMSDISSYLPRCQVLKFPGVAVRS